MCSISHFQPDMLKDFVSQDLSAAFSPESIIGRYIHTVRLATVCLECMQLYIRNITVGKM